MNKGWPTKTLQTLCEDINVGHVGPSSMHRDPDGISFLMGKNVGVGVIYTHNIERVTEAFHRSQPKSRLRAGDIVVVRIGKSGQAAKIPEGFGEANCSGLVVIKQPHGIHPDFLVYYLNSPIGRGYSLSQARGSTRLTLNTSSVAETLVPVPPFPEQQRIVSILDEAIEGLATATANAEKNLRNARALFESHLESVFTQRGEGWVEKQLAELCDIKHGFAFDGEFFSSKGEYVLLTPGNFYEKGGYRDRGEKQKYYTGEIPDDYVLNEGDLLVAMTEQAAGLLGSPILVPESDKYLHNQRLGLVTKKPGVPWINEFFFHVFNTQTVRKEIHDSASGVKVRHTSPTKIGEVVVSFPTLISEQRTIVSTLKDLHEETQRLESIYQQKLAALGELKKSLLHQAFSGAL
jgi:type I restriction enzyme S subunit